MVGGDIMVDEKDINVEDMIADENIQEEVQAEETVQEDTVQDEAVEASQDAAEAIEEAAATPTPRQNQLTSNSRVMMNHTGMLFIHILVMKIKLRLILRKQ